jgi:hypothetical protein
MSLEEIKAIIRRRVDEPWNKGDVDVIDELCAPECAIHSQAANYFAPPVGRAAATFRMKWNLGFLLARYSI